MAPRGKHAKRPSVNTILNFADGLNYHPNLDRVEDCPAALKEILVLINRTRLVHEDLNPQLEGRKFKASDIYDKQLMWRAEEMSEKCSGRGMNNQSEFGWQSDMSPHAFLSLNNKDEEKTHNERQYHHCLACCRVFRPGSRPLLDARPNATAQSNAEAILKGVDPSQICPGDKHFNLPNFVFTPQLRYKYQEEEGQSSRNPRSGIPDATIGLCAYNLRNEPWQKQRRDLRTDPRIEPFSQGFLKEIFENHKDLKGPYPTQVLNDGVPLFAFALWEAKKSDGDSHWSAFTQLDKKVSRLLQWQDAIINEAENDSNEFFPVVWAFTSVGSLWTVYGCYQSLFKEDEKHFASSVALWSGNVSDKNQALQLLWIVDIVKFWAEYTYKPMIGACLARIKAQVDKHAEVSLGKTLWESHITLNKEKTPWFFHPANSPRHKSSQPHNSSLSGDNRPKLKYKSLSDQHSPGSPETAPNQTLHRRLTLNEQQIDDFTWLQDRDPQYGDLLVMRIGREGKIDKPLILLDSTSSSNSARYSGKALSHAGVDVGLIKENGGVYLLGANRGFFSSDYQFCAILPLEPRVYHDQRRKSKKSSIFEPLEKLLDLDGLYHIFDRECNSHLDRKRPQVKDNSNVASDEEEEEEDEEEKDEEEKDEEEKDEEEKDEVEEDEEEEGEEEEGEEEEDEEEQYREEEDEEEEDEEEKDEEEKDEVEEDEEEEGEEEEGEEEEDEEEQYREEEDEEEEDEEEEDEEEEDEEEEYEEEEDEGGIHDDDVEPTTDKDELNIPEKLDQRLENVHRAWKSHKWPNEKSKILTFARVAFRLQSARIKAYNVKDGEMYSQGDEVPIDWMTPVKGFGKSFLLVQRKQRRSSISKSADDQSYKSFDMEQTVVGSGDEGKKAMGKLPYDFKSFGVK